MNNTAILNIFNSDNSNIGYTKTQISPNFLMWRFFGKTQFPHSFGRIAQNYAESVPPQNFHTRKLVEIMAFFAVES